MDEDESVAVVAIAIYEVGAELVEALHDLTALLERQAAGE